MYLILRSIACIICLSLFAYAQAQTKNDSVKTAAEEGAQSEQRLSASPPEYVIELSTPDGCVFAPINPRGNSGCLQYTLPRPANFMPDSAGHPIVSLITFYARRSGEMWDLNVVEGSGEFYDAATQRIAKATLPTNGRADIPQLDVLGLGSFRVGVFKVVGQASAKPLIANKTRSISLEKVEDQTLRKSIESC